MVQNKVAPFYGRQDINNLSLTLHAQSCRSYSLDAIQRHARNARSERKQRRRELKRVRGAGSCNFPTEENMAAQNSNFGSKFPQNGGFAASILHFSDKKIPTRRKFSASFPTTQNLGGGAIAPPPLYSPVTTPLNVRKYATNATEAADASNATTRTQGSSGDYSCVVFVAHCIALDGTKLISTLDEFEVSK